MSTPTQPANGPATRRKNLGEILVASGTITEKTLQRALERAKRENRTVGVTLEEMGVVTGEEIAAALAEQFGCQLVKDFARYSYPAELLKMVSVDTATRNLLFPLKLNNGALFLAMTDPTDTKVVAILAQNLKVSVVPVVASRNDIILAISRHYLGKESEANPRTTVVVVDDSAAIRAELEQMLAKEGFRVMTAKDGLEAFKLILTETPAVVVTDKDMPVFSGYMLQAAMRSLPETSRIPVILLTASQNETEEAEAFQKGFYDYIAKPVSMVTLITRVKRALQG